VSIVRSNNFKLEYEKDAVESVAQFESNDTIDDYESEAVMFLFSEAGFKLPIITMKSSEINFINLILTVESPPPEYLLQS
jgi:hypothetical protein